MASHTGPNHMYNSIRNVDIHDTGLVDECPRCTEHAERPMHHLDDRMLSNLISRVLNNFPPRSTNEAIAMNNVGNYILYAKKLLEVNPNVFN